MKRETVVETTTSQTSASSIYLPQELNWQSELLQSRWDTSAVEMAVQSVDTAVVASLDIEDIDLADGNPTVFQPFPIRGGLVTNELIDKLREEIGD